MHVLTQLIDQQAPLEGMNKTSLANVNLYRASQAYPRGVFYYDQGFIFVAQGSEQVYFNGDALIYDRQHFLTVPWSQPAEFATQASTEEPLLALTLDINLNLLKSMAAQIQQYWQGKTPSVTKQQLWITPVSQQIEDTLIRLLQALQEPLHSEVLGEGILRELLFWILNSDQGQRLMPMLTQYTTATRIEPSIRWIHQHYQKKVEVKALAAMVHMSESSFHRHFRSVTDVSPIQYVKQVRLNHAKRQLLETRQSVKETASAVGYESVSQFSREFKRCFGHAPVNLGRQAKLISLKKNEGREI